MRMEMTEMTRPASPTSLEVCHKRKQRMEMMSSYQFIVYFFICTEITIEHWSSDLAAVQQIIITHDCSDLAYSFKIVEIIIKKKKKRKPEVFLCAFCPMQRTWCPCWTQTFTLLTPVWSSMPTPCSLRTSATLATLLSDAPHCLVWDPPEVTQQPVKGRQAVAEALVAELVVSRVCVCMWM